MPLRDALNWTNVKVRLQFYCHFKPLHLAKLMAMTLWITTSLSLNCLLSPINRFYLVDSTVQQPQGFIFIWVVLRVHCLFIHPHKHSLSRSLVIAFRHEPRLNAINVTRKKPNPSFISVKCWMQYKNVD